MENEVETRRDTLIRELEQKITDVNKTTFLLEGYKEDIERMEDKQPFLVRQIEMNRKKLVRTSKQLEKDMLIKQDLETELGAMQVAESAEKKPKPVGNTNIEEKPKE